MVFGSGASGRHMTLSDSITITNASTASTSPFVGFNAHKRCDTLHFFAFKNLGTGSDTVTVDSSYVVRRKGE
jgi:hypothetical protein